MNKFSQFSKILILVIFILIPVQGWAQTRTYNWQKFTTPFTEDQVRNFILPNCMPIDPALTVDPNFCYILQRQCWMDKSGYGPCVVQNCRHGQEYGGEFTDSPLTGVNKWFCPQGPNGVPAVLPPADCNPLDDIWRDRITRDPACQRK